ncbi:MAG: hypothetical protein HOP08_00795 [Cyclobacteriaceae bacterium]|nr:hypothetical protein [Cyclobacteriaceae bacterium]
MGPNVRYELQEIERLIAVGLDDQADERIVAVSRDMLKAESERIRNTLINEVFSFEDERHLERYIQYHQQAIIQLMDEVARKELDHHTSSMRLNVHFYNVLAGLLQFIERYFSKYFDQNVKAPHSYLAVTGKVAQRNIVRLKKRLSKAGADPEIIAVLMNPIGRAIQKETTDNITYRNVMYGNLMQTELFRLLEQYAPGSDINEPLRNLILYVNYNSDEALRYLFHHIDSLMRSEESCLQKIERLSFALKTVNQASQKPGISYCDEMPSVKHMMSDYLNEEIIFQSRFQNQAAPSARGDVNFEGSFKMKFDVSVAQVSLLVKAFVETKIIQNGNLAELLRFIATFIITKKSEQISYDSLRAKYYNVEQGTKSSVRNLLVTMVQYLDRS